MKFYPNALAGAILCLYMLVLSGCGSTTGVETGDPNKWMAHYDPNKIGHDKVIAEVRSVFASHGYQTRLGRVSGVAFGPGGVNSTLKGDVRDVDTETQPGISGVQPKGWKYRASVESGDVTLLVFVTCPPSNFLGATLDMEVSQWHPPDEAKIIHEVQQRLNR